MFSKSFVVMSVLAGALASQAFAKDASALKILKCSLEVQTNDDTSTSTTTSSGNLILNDVMGENNLDVTTLGLVPVVSAVDKDVRALVYAYQLSSAEIHVMLKIDLNGAAFATKIFTVDTDEVPFIVSKMDDNVSAWLTCSTR